MNRVMILLVLLALLGKGCGVKEFDCDDMPIEPAFIGFEAADIDTLVFRKYKPDDGFRQLVDTTVVTYNSLYRTSNDTTRIIHFNLEDGFTPGYDWQLFMPAVDRTIRVTEIRSSQKTGSCGTRAVGAACSCLNDLFSAKRDGQVVTFSDVHKEYPFIYIRK